MEASYELCRNGNVSPEEINALRRSVGWNELDGYQEILAESEGYFIARSGSKIVGFVNTLGDNIQDILLVDVIVHPDFQRRGLGRRLVTAAVDDIRSRRVRFTHIIFEPALREFYEKCGYRASHLAAVIDTI